MGRTEMLVESDRELELEVTLSSNGMTWKFLIALKYFRVNKIIMISCSGERICECQSGMEGALMGSSPCGTVWVCLLSIYG